MSNTGWYILGGIVVAGAAAGGYFYFTYERPPAPPEPTVVYEEMSIDDILNENAELIVTLEPGVPQDVRLHTIDDGDDYNIDMACVSFFLGSELSGQFLPAEYCLVDVEAESVIPLHDLETQLLAAERSETEISVSGLYRNDVLEVSGINQKTAYGEETLFALEEIEDIEFLEGVVVHAEKFYDGSEGSSLYTVTIRQDNDLFLVLFDGGIKGYSTGNTDAMDKLIGQSVRIEGLEQEMPNLYHGLRLETLTSE